ncbi:glycerate kinase [Lactiplantibacillus pentosus]
MHALIAIDSFKNSITSIQANQLVARRFEAHGLATTQVAIADGGEGTVAAWLANHAGGQSITAQTVDLAQQPLEATYGYFAATNCQIKCNFLPKKTSDGVFQPKTLRGRLFKSLTNFAIS